MSNQLSKDGFPFKFDSSKCSECSGKCCRGESGAIFLNSSEIANISNFLKIESSIFIRDYLKKIGFKYSIKELKIGGEHYCLFFDLDKRNCSIYEVRPTQCKSFPFWDYFKSNKDEVARECIGILL